MHVYEFADKPAAPQGEGICWTDTNGVGVFVWAGVFGPHFMPAGSPRRKISRFGWAAGAPLAA